MAYRVDLTPQAVADIEEAFQYINQATPIRSKRWLTGLMDMVYSLEEMPERFPVAPESADFGKEIRQALYGKRTGIYRIIFRIHREASSDGVVRVICVRHGARDRLKPEDLDE
ncbi:MAG: type II toxin-antitoxin system RelE/ParE family toxin [Armatimonadota bacterium]